MKHIINVLGINYSIKTNAKRCDDLNANGLCETQSKILYLNDFQEQAKDTESLELLTTSYRNKVLRHEIVHAFLFESGMSNNSCGVKSWATNEEMVDWFAIQSPKIFKIYQELEIL